jgi:hypothetical protein
MKAFLRVVFVIIVIIVVWVIYVNRQAAEREKERLEMERLQQERVREETTRQALPPTIAQPLAPTPVPRVILNRPALSKKAEIYEAAKAAHVVIVSYSEKDGTAIIDCRATDRNYLGDFLDELMNRGIMKDLDLNKKSYRVTNDRQGRATHWAHYEIRF